MSARAFPYADLLVESMAQNSSFLSLAARSLSRSMRCCSVIDWVSRVIAFGVRSLEEGVFATLCHLATRVYVYFVRYGNIASVMMSLTISWFPLKTVSRSCCIPVLVAICSSSHMSPYRRFWSLLLCWGLFGFCCWVCFFVSLMSQFLGKMSWARSLGEARKYCCPGVNFRFLSIVPQWMWWYFFLFVVGSG